MTTFTVNKMHKMVEAGLSYRPAEFVVSIFPKFNKVHGGIWTVNI